MNLGTMITSSCSANEAKDTKNDADKSNVLQIITKELPPANMAVASVVLDRETIEEHMDSSRDPVTDQTTMDETPEQQKRSIDETSDSQDTNSKRLKASSVPNSDYILTHLHEDYKKKLEVFLDNVLELFFLENEGNIMDYFSWKRKIPIVSIRQYLKENSLEINEDLDDLLLSKASSDAPAIKQSSHLNTTPIIISNVPETPLSSIVPTTPSSLSPNVTLSTLSPLPSTSLPSTDLVKPLTTSISSLKSSPLINTSSIISKSVTPTSGISTSFLTNTSVISSTPSSNRHSTRQHSISAVYDSAIGSQQQIVERAKQEASVIQKIAELRKQGLWSAKKLPKVQEPPRVKAHWDYLLEEMAWLAGDFAQEKKWKKAAAKKCARMILKHFQDKELQAEKAEREELMRLKKIAASIAKQVKEFWSNIEQLVEHKQQTRLEEKRKKALDLHLNYIVGQTEKYSSWLAEGMNVDKPNIIEEKDQSSILPEDDSDFDPNNSLETDDEETIAKEESEIGISTDKNELQLLKEESEMNIEDLLNTLPPEILEKPASILSETETEEDTDLFDKNEDKDFDVEKVKEEDDEKTIQEEEALEKNVDHSTELKELEDDANMPIEDLLEKYRGAYESDFDFDSIVSEDESTSLTEDEENDVNSSTASDEDNESLMSFHSETEEIGMEYLINPEGETKNQKSSLIEVISEDGKSIKSPNKPGPSREITDIAAGAESIRPKGNTLSTAQVTTKVPFLLKHQLREYQHVGLDWLVAMHNKKLNGILADEMGLGKTIQTIALLAHLACDKGVWGPHLIVVPTSVMLNWEMEFKKWCPAFKILTYYGNPKERKLKRQGWTKPNQFHVCITSYKLVIQDHQSFRRKKWRYLILDEAQHIKNFKSQRWQMLLNFNSSRRLLLTGTPLQNNLMELWSLMHFLMPNVFQSHRDFKDWFVNPVTGMIEGNHEFNEGLIKRLHKILRPFLLRRLKCEVEKQLPKKYEHVVLCRLSKRQQYLYEDFMSLTKTKETLATGNFLSVINVLMQLRKVCNHPNLFESRPIISPFSMEGITYNTASLTTKVLEVDPFKRINLENLNLALLEYSSKLSAFAQHRIKKFQATKKLIEEIDSVTDIPPKVPRGKIRLQIRTTTTSTSTASTANLPTKTIASVVKPFAPSSISISRQGPQSINFMQPKYVLLSNPSTTIKSTPSSNSGVITVTESSASVTCVPTSASNIIKQLTITTPLSSIGRQPTQLGNQKVKIQIGKLVQTPSGQHILVRPLQPTSPATNTPSSTIVTPSSPKQLISLNKLHSPSLSSPATSPVKQPTLTRTSGIETKREQQRRFKLDFLANINLQRCSISALYAKDLIEMATVCSHPRLICTKSPNNRTTFNIGQGYFHCQHALSANKKAKDYVYYTEPLISTLRSPEERLSDLYDILSRYLFVTPPVSAPRIKIHVSHPHPSKKQAEENYENELRLRLTPKLEPLHLVHASSRTQFPELRLIEYDCGKLQTLDKLLLELKSGSHRVLIFTQMSRMLDIFEQFLNYHGHTYLRLDGSTKIEQRQALMERFNADKRIFCFILSTRSGGIGVNLTGADTVIFYDSDWNPTMDAQAQDRCHRIGQTRDVHIYRLISERTVEENILKKAQQKRLLGDVAIEGGNFTTAYFKKESLHELFNMEAPNRNLFSVDPKMVSNESSSDQSLDVQLEQALCTAEEDTDVKAASTAKAEAAAEFAEFDESIPIDIEAKDNEEKSPAEEEVDRVIEQLTPVEKYAMQFLETLQEPFQTEQLKLAEEEIEAQKKDWELGHLKSLKEEEERERAEHEKEKEDLLTMSREDAYNQVYISCNRMEQMPVWAPPTPPQDENDLYVDYSMGFLYEQSVMPESQLPPIYVPKDAKRLKIDPTINRRREIKTKKDEVVNIPRSLFDRPSPALLKLRRELKIQKLRGSLVGGPDTSLLQRLLNSIGANVTIPQPATLAQQAALSKTPQILLSGLQQENQISWNINEDWSVLEIIQYLQEIPLNLLILSPGHTPNWDLVSDVMNSATCSYRSPKICRHHYESVIIPREEGKLLYDPTPKKMKKQNKGPQTPGLPNSSPSPSIALGPVVSKSSQARPMRTSHLFMQDANASFSQNSSSRFDSIKQIANKRSPTVKPLFINPTGKNPKHIALLQESGIVYEQPLNPVQVASNRAERIAKIKNQQLLDQQQAARQKQQSLQLKQTQAKPLVPTTVQSGSQQFAQQIQAKVASLSQSSANLNITKPNVSGSFLSAAHGTIALNQSPHFTNISKTINPGTSFALSTNQTLTTQGISQTTSNTGSLLPTIQSVGNTRQPSLISQNTSDVSSGSNQNISQAVSQATSTLLSVTSVTPQKLLAATITPTSTTKLTPAQFQVYKQQVMLRQQAQQRLQSPQLPVTSQQVTLQQQVHQQLQQPVTRVQFAVTSQPNQQSSQSQQTQSIVVTSSLKPGTIMTSSPLPVALPLASGQQQRLFTTTSSKPQQVITRNATEAEVAQLLGQRTQQQRQQQQTIQQTQGTKSISLQTGLSQAQIIQLQQAVQQQAQHQQGTHTTQILQNPISAIVKTVSSANTLTSGAQTVTIPVSAVTMTGVNILPTSVVTKVGVSNTSSIVTSAPTLSQQQLRQLQLLQQKRLQQAQQSQQSHLITQVSQSTGTSLNSQLTTQTQLINPQTQQKISAALANQSKSSQLPQLSTIQIVHQGPSGQQTPKSISSVTMQQLQQVLKQQGGLVLPHNLPHTIHVTQSTQSGTQIIPQSIIHAMTQSKNQPQGQQDSTSHTTIPTSIAVAQQIKHIQVVATSASQQPHQSGVTPKSFVISGQPAQAILQATALQQTQQPQTLTFAIRTAPTVQTTHVQPQINQITTNQSDPEPPSQQNLPSVLTLQDGKSDGDVNPSDSSQIGDSQLR